MRKNGLSKVVCIIGGGASGFFCAVNLARLKPGYKIVILEKSSKLLSKVKISGGGRCNVTHACFDIAEMARRYPRGQYFVKKLFHRFFTKDTIEWFRERGVQLKAEADGRMFPVTDSSQTIIDCLLKEANRYGVEISMQCAVQKIIRSENGFVLQTSKQEALVCDFVCVASGGFPKTEMFHWLTETGHSIASPVPSLFTFNSPGNSLTSLMGLSVKNARVSIAGTKISQTGPVLITHWGLSGPAVLRLSAWAARELASCNWMFTAVINWLPEYTEQNLQVLLQSFRTERATQFIASRNSFGLPGRLWNFLLELSEIDEKVRWADLPAKTGNKLIKNLVAFELAVRGKTTYKEEFVTAGGVRLSEIDAGTMMSKKVGQLFFMGEVLDVDGITGGFNFQNAWSTGFVAATAIAAYGT